jgi:hypothetical protein
VPASLWREVALARVLLAAGDTIEAEATLRPLSPATPRQSVVVGMLLALSLADRLPDEAHEQTVTALRTAAAVGMHHSVITTGTGVAELIDKASWAFPPAWTERARAALAVGAKGPVEGRVRGLVEQPTARERASPVA